MSLGIREVQIKAIMRYHLVPVRIPVIKKVKSVSKDVEKLKPLDTVGGNVNGATTMKNSMEIPQEVKNETSI